MKYQSLNNITGWVVFALSLLVYTLTLEPTASFWDCGEFIAVARHLQTPHPPGAPIFSLLGRVFSLFSGDGWNGFSFSEDAAYWVNMLSAVSGAFTSLFLFWSITILAKKLLKIEGEASLPEKIAVLGAGFVGAMASTFCDSIWFSAVEAEVYAISVFFTSFVLWAMLRRSILTSQVEKDRWMILIAYMVGLSIGVHLLNLVAIPALALIVYFENKSPTWKGGILTFLLSGVILLAILSGLPGLTSIAFWFDRFFKGMGLPFNFGAFFFFAGLVGSLVYGIIYSIKNSKRILNVALLSTSFILIGFFSYFLIIIRSQQDPTIDENNPEDLVNFISYLNREQYGDRPLVFGPQYNIDLQRSWQVHNSTYGAPSNNPRDYMYKKGNVKYKKVEDRYEPYDTAFSYAYPSEFESFLPRMYSSDPGHIEQYKSLLAQYNNGYFPTEYYDGKISFIDNMHYMFDRQLGRMYWRYFLWNFVGRERQEQYAGNMSLTSPSNEELPELIRHAARNNFYAIPLIIGLIGLIYQFFKDQFNFAVILALFVFTGMAIIIYLNAPPTEPRERDYAYAGSYMAFCIWIGLAVIALYDVLSKALKNKLGAASLGLILCLLAPSLMGAIGWDDHDRSRRYFSVDSAKNLLNSCAQNAILFTAGDNDTFPLWYVQEVEGFRTDVRVCNLSLLNTDWYVDQMKRKAHLSQPLPITFVHDDYLQGTLDYLPFDINSRKNVARKYYVKNGEETRYAYELDPGFSLDRYITLVREKSNKVTDMYGSKLMPEKIARKFTIPIDSAQVANFDWVPQNLKSRVVNQMSFDNKAGAILKKDLIMLDIINSVSKSGWDRPIYFSTTAGAPGGDNFQGIREYLQQEALAYRLIPASGNGNMNEPLTFDILTKGFAYRGLNDTTITYTEDYDRMVQGIQYIYIQLAMQYVQSDNKEKAKELLDFYQSKISSKNFPWKTLSPLYLSLVYEVYGTEAGDKAYAEISQKYFDLIEYYIRSGEQSEHRNEHISLAVRVLGSQGGLLNTLMEKKRDDLVKKHQSKLQKIANALGLQSI